MENKKELCNGNSWKLCVIQTDLGMEKKFILCFRNEKKKKKSLNMNYDFLSPLVICWWYKQTCETLYEPEFDLMPALLTSASYLAQMFSLHFTEVNCSQK